ncbi:MAG: TIGR01459 family HAD-type hydrolase [Devosiaceae bacterium]|nr:TIGR01459 family HAD-type hydrolase [Devosiaceae bacterium]
MINSAKQITNLSDISSNYSALICDIWGVVHNGLVANEAAVVALIKHRQMGGKVILVTNASRTAPFIKKMLDNMNITQEAYDVIVTSGDVTRNHIKKYSGDIIHHVGSITDGVVFDGLNITKGNAHEAKAIVITGLDKDDDGLEKYQTRLNKWLELGLELICTNPDKVVEIGDKILYCPGAIADLYQEMGGKIIMAGKPSEVIYNAAFLEIEKITGNKINLKTILAIGDSVRTDATGAANMGIDFLFITGSIHAKEIDAFDNVDEKIHQLVAPSKANLIGYQDKLK